MSEYENKIEQQNAAWKVWATNMTMLKQIKKECGLESEPQQEEVATNNSKYQYEYSIGK